MLSLQWHEDSWVVEVLCLGSMRIAKKLEEVNRLWEFIPC
jgi:hypothetical protein